MTEDDDLDEPDFNDSHEWSQRRERDRREELNDADRERLDRGTQARLSIASSEDRMRQIFNEELGAFVRLIATIGGTWLIGYRYGTLYGLGFLAVAGVGSWWVRRSQAKQPHPNWRIEHITTLAEDTEDHLTIVRKGEAGEHWCHLVDGDLNWEKLRDYPYWRNVGAHASRYRWMREPERLKHNLEARSKSLPWRLRLKAELGEQGLTMPAWLDTN